MTNLKDIRVKYTKELYNEEFTIHLLKNLYGFLESELVKKLEYFSDYDKAAILCAIEHIERLQELQKNYDQLYKEYDELAEQAEIWRFESGN
jgi:hypothetical protein